MPMSDYDRWKTTPPAYLQQPGDCLQCGSGAQWISGRALIARRLRAQPRTARRQLLPAFKALLSSAELCCAACGREALRARYSPCGCGAVTAWECACP